MEASRSPVRAPGRSGRTPILGVMVIASVLIALGTSAASAASGAPQARGVGKWQQAMEKLRVPGKGCFKASFPKVEWLKTACKKAPRHPYPPARGHRPQIVGNGNDYSAEVSSGLINSVTGSFDSVSAGATETGQQNGGGPQVANTFSLQINSKPFTTTACAGSPNPGCRGWQQFIYSTTYNVVFMQYWLLKYNTTCPAGWNTFTFPMSTDIYCYKNSASGTLSGGPLTVGGLTGTRLTGSAHNPGNDSVVMTTGGGMASAVGAGSVLRLANGWKGVEFAIVGDCCGSQANFSAGTSIRVRTTVHNGTTNAPLCVLEGFTGETNNLNLAATPAIGVQPAPTIVSNQTSAPGMAGCAAAAGLGDTHLTTFRNLLYDFQAAGDFELATTGPRFVVQVRQISGAPTWPNAAVNEAVATRIGKSTVALCLTPNPAGGPPVHLVINRKPVTLANGSQRNLADGGDVSLHGNAYLIRSANGDSVGAQVNTGSPDWINVSVGLGRWPEKVHGLLANAGANPHAIESRGGLVLTAPFPFDKFYHQYGESWRVTPKESLLSVCGDKVVSSDPQNVFYANNIDPKLARTARDICLGTGVKVAPLLDACTVDVAVLGNKAAAVVYRTVSTHVIWGKITLPPFLFPANRR